MYLKDKVGNSRVFLYWGYLTIIGVLFLFLNHYTPLSDDDFHYCYIYGTDTHITTIKDILQSQYIHYMQMNGRFITHFLVQLFDGIIGKTIFNICNSICFIIFLHLITITVSTNKKQYFFVLTMIIIFLIYIIPEFRYPFLWMSGACNYLWTAVLLLTYNKLFQYDIPNKYIPLLFIYSFICGWTHEGFIIGLLFGYTLYLLINKDKFTKSRQYQLIGLLCGALFLLLSPGSFKRYLNTTNDISLLNHIVTYIKVIIDLKNIRFLPILLIILIIFHNRKIINLNRFIKGNIVFIVAIIVLIPFTILTKNTSYTSRFGFEIFSLLLILRILLNKYSSTPILLLTGINIISIVFLVFAIHYCKLNYDDYKSQLKQIESNKSLIITNSSKVNYIFEKFILRHRNTDFSGDYYFIENIYFKKHILKNKKIAFVPQRLLEKIKKSPEKFDKFHLISSDIPFYVKQINKDVNKVTFKLKEQDNKLIPIYIRPIAHKFARYTIQSLDTPYYNTFNYENNQYIMVAKNNAIDNRLDEIRIE